MSSTSIERAPELFTDAAEQPLEDVYAQLEAARMRYAAVADTSRSQERRQTQAAYQQAWVRHLMAAAEVAPEEIPLSSGAVISDELRYEREELIKARRQEWHRQKNLHQKGEQPDPQSLKGRLANGLKRQFGRKKTKSSRKEPNWHLLRGKLMENPSYQPTEQDLERITRNFLGMEPAQAQNRALTEAATSAKRLEKKKPRRTRRMMAGGVALAAAGLLAVGIGSSQRATPEVPQPANSGDTAAETVSSAGKTIRSFNASLGQVALLCDLEAQQASHEIRQHQIEQQKAKLKWRSVKTEPDVWAWKRGGDYKLYANQNSSKTNSTSGIVAQALKLRNGTTPNTAKVAEIEQEITAQRLAQGKSPLLQPHEAVVVKADQLD